MAQLSELGPSTGFAGGVTSRIDPELSRPYNWEYTVGVDHELLPGFGVGGTYYRRLLRNLIGSLNMAVLPSDYIPVTITNPLTNEPLTVYNQSAATVGRRDTVVTNQETLDSDYNGLEFRANARLRSRGILAGGITYGRIESGSGDTNNPNTLINFLGVDSSVQYKLVRRPAAALGHAGERIVSELLGRGVVAKFHGHPRASAEPQPGDPSRFARARAANCICRESAWSISAFPRRFAGPRGKWNSSSTCTTCSTRTP